MHDGAKMAEFALNAARIAATEGKDDEAHASLQQVLELGSSTQVAHARIELAYLHAPRNPVRATELLKEAQTAAASLADCDLLLELGAAWRRINHPLYAKQVYRQVLDRIGAPTAASPHLLPQDGAPFPPRTRFFAAFAYYELGDIVFETGGRSASASYFEVARRYNDPNVSPFAALALACKIGVRAAQSHDLTNPMWPQRLEWLLREAIRYDHPEASPEAALEFGRLLMKHRQVDRACTWFKRVLEDPGNPRRAERAREELAEAERCEQLQPAAWRKPAAAQQLSDHARRVLILGGGTGGQYLYDCLQLGASAHRYDVIGYLDDAYAKDAELPNGKRVLGPISALGELLHGDQRPDLVWIAMPTAPPATKRHVATVCADEGIQVQTLPTMHEVVRVSNLVMQRRDVRVDDLLGSGEVLVDEEAAAWLRAKRVLIVGGGRTLGVELARKAADAGADSIVLVDRDDDALKLTELDLRARCYEAVHTCQASAVAADTIVQLAKAHGCNVLFHAASSWSGTERDVHRQQRVLWGLLGLVDKLEQIPTLERFVWVSDANVAVPSTPTRALAAVTEAIAVSQPAEDERVVRCAVRAPALYTSPGSVVSRLEHLAQRGSPLRVPPATCRLTHAYRAAELVLHAARIAKSCEVLSLDCGDDVSYTQMAELILQLRGVQPHEEHAIEEDPSLVVDEAPRPSGTETEVDGVLRLGRIHSAPALRDRIEALAAPDSMDVMQVQRECCGDMPEAQPFGPTLPRPVLAFDAGELPV